MTGGLYEDFGPSALVPRQSARATRGRAADDPKLRPREAGLAQAKKMQKRVRASTRFTNIVDGLILQKQLLLVNIASGFYKKPAQGEQFVTEVLKPVTRKECSIYRIVRGVQPWLGARGRSPFDGLGPLFIHDIFFNPR